MLLLLNPSFQSCLRAKQLGELLEADQLTAARKLDQAFAGFDEDAPSFFPTFKLAKSAATGADAGADEHVKAEPSKEFEIATVHTPDGIALNYVLQRIPAFCDRILVKSAKVELSN